jgi:hypothetical protein
MIMRSIRVRLSSVLVRSRFAQQHLGTHTRSREWLAQVVAQRRHELLAQIALLLQAINNLLRFF